ncbi:hypothetical protein SCLCIDRAFT_432911 [Scleroderma citrinum Foug A]|uniref:Uncharacterized protein n=1 Tax=Scleroderma citrinum Foug A TaxID=1036808 RepID=A0A0C2ZLE8_9AGAM|nr:hypothetical protein SCLCIDRAFT_432911 [Scleroderma citrinum Foug A]
MEGPSLAQWGAHEPVLGTAATEAVSRELLLYLSALHCSIKGFLHLIVREWLPQLQYHSGSPHHGKQELFRSHSFAKMNVLDPVHPEKHPEERIARPSHIWAQIDFIVVTW